MARRALILANNSFVDPSIPALASPCSDGERLRDLLAREEIGGYEVSYHANPGSVEARIAVQSFFRSAGAGDFNLILISGHGIRDSQGHLHFAMADTRSDVLAATSLDAAFVIRQMDLSAASKQVAVIDTCYSGAFVHGMVAKAATQRISRTDFANTEIDNVRGRAVITASTHIQVANENEAGGLTQSVFTRHLIEGIETGAADADGDGVIALPELFDYISARLKAEGSVQTPRSYDYGLGGRVIIALNPVQIAELPSALQKKLASRSKAQKLLAVEQLHEIALKGGFEAPIAIEALQKLLRDDFALVRQMAQDALDGLVVEPEPEPELPTSAPPAPPAPTPAPSPVELTADSVAPQFFPGGETADRVTTVPAARPWRVVVPIVLALIVLFALPYLGFYSLGTVGSVAGGILVVLAVLIGIGAFVSKTSDAKGATLLFAVGLAVAGFVLLAAVGVFDTEKEPFELNRELDKMAGIWTFSDDPAACLDTSRNKTTIQVNASQIRIDGEDFPRESLSVENGWIKVGERYFRSDGDKLVYAGDPKPNALNFRLLRCATVAPLPSPGPSATTTSSQTPPFFVGGAALMADPTNLSGRWVWGEDTSGCENSAVAKMIIAVTDAAIQIDDQIYARDTAVLDQGWLKLGDRYYSLDDANLLRSSPGGDGAIRIYRRCTGSASAM